MHGHLQALKIHQSRWEYLHSDFHAAAYALDPEFLDTNGDLDSATQDGVMAVLERLSLREVMLEAQERGEDPMLVQQTDDQSSRAYLRQSENSPPTSSVKAPLLVRQRSRMRR